MLETAPKTGGGFDIAELTCENTGEALRAKASPFPDSATKARLLIISSNEVNESIPVKDKETRKTSKKPKRTTNRKQVTFNDSITHCGKTYQINNNSKGEKKLGLYVETMQRIIEQFEIGLAKWKRVFVLRFELHMSRETKDNKIMTAFRKRLFQKLKREYGFKEIGYCWAREYHGKGKGQHYHWVLFLNGNLIRHSSLINEMIKQAWEQPAHGLMNETIKQAQEETAGGYTIGWIKRPYYFADNEQIAQDAIYRVSYLAKTRGKGYRPPQTKDFQCSRMKLTNKLQGITTVIPRMITNSKDE